MVKSTGQTVGFVPTMGRIAPWACIAYEQAAQACEEVVVSIFVNPTQFNNQEDFETYPLTLEADIEMASRLERRWFCARRWMSCMGAISQLPLWIMGD